MSTTLIKKQFYPLYAGYCKLSDNYLIINTPNQVVHFETREQIDALVKLVEWLKEQGEKIS